MDAILPAPAPARNIRPHSRRAVAVVDPNGRWWPSMTSAAIAWNRDPSTVYVQSRLGRGGWRIATEADAPATTSA